MRASRSPAARFLAATDFLLQALSRDQVTARLLLFEGRKIKGRNSPQPPDALSRLDWTLDEILESIGSDHALGPAVPAQALRAALVGAFEGLAIERLSVGADGEPDGGSFDAARASYRAVAGALLKPVP